jgi:hypothetical protein
MVIAIDFDGTIVQNRYPNVGNLQPDARRCINQLHDDGHYIIIWTCRTGERLLEAINFLLDVDIKFNRVNRSEPSNEAKYGGHGRKVGADVYVDDRQVGGLPPWKDVYQAITGRVME